MQSWIEKISNLRRHELVSLRQRHGSCGDNHSERIIPACSQMSGYYGGVCFVKFSEETKH